MSATGGALSLMDNLPALQVAVPLIAAPICTFLRFRNGAWAFALLVSAAVFWMSWLLLQQVLVDGVISYHMGGWAPPIGIEYRVDRVNAFVILIVAMISLITLPFAKATVEREVPADKHHLFYAAWLLCITGLLGIAITGDAFNVFVFLEISSLSSYVLIAAGRDPRALTASFQYLILGTLGATFILIGVGLLYIMTGTLNMMDLADRIPAIAHTTPVRAAAGFLTVGIALKAALFPAHFWLPNGYAFSPNAVSVLLSATATKVSIYLLLRFELTVFGDVDAVGDFSFANLLLPFAVAAFVLGSVSAIFQSDVKRLLAYSSVAQIGYMIAGLGLGSVDGVTAGIVHLFNHALMKAALFMAAGAVFMRAGGVQLANFAGMGRRMPLTMFAFVLAGLSLIGVPLTVGFVSKWYLVLAALQTGPGGYVLTGLILASSLLSVIYVWRVVEVAYLRDPEPDAPRHEAPLSVLAPMWLLVVACFWFGIDSSFTVGIARDAAIQLMGPGQ
ncbi:monovalent cation/H+ antiporter subunit D family protein [Minwuia thermotolerans]|uniref:monovalent cation/H+ antiporter subunit D family protein n=1 Tax=Minwuia thermotolerans TaxID=2056226 RepID=UPI0019D08E75|nr:monovalent cation/H+ antiporter subunit D family protein [Minwuia thermotolerans]